MIYEDALNNTFVSRDYFTGKIDHYQPIDRTPVVESKLLRLGRGDTLYTASSKIFRDLPGGAANWALVAENSDLKRPQDWQSGEEINVPLLLIVGIDD